MNNDFKEILSLIKEIALTVTALATAVITVKAIKPNKNKKKTKK